MEGKEITFGIRSEHIHDKEWTSDVPEGNVVTARVEVVEPMGSEIFLYMNTGKHSFTARVDAHDKPRVNQDLQLVFDMDHVHFFDKDSEETLI